MKNKVNKYIRFYDNLKTNRDNDKAKQIIYTVNWDSFKDDLCKAFLYKNDKLFKFYDILKNELGCSTNKRQELYRILLKLLSNILKIQKHRK